MLSRIFPRQDRLCVCCVWVFFFPISHSTISVELYVVDFSLIAMLMHSSRENEIKLSFFSCTCFKILHFRTIYWRLIKCTDMAHSTSTMKAKQFVAKHTYAFTCLVRMKTKIVNCKTFTYTVCFILLIEIKKEARAKHTHINHW